MFGYNYLNLPISAVKSGLSLSYVYDATGTKLRKANNTIGETTDYIDGIQYVNGSIVFIQTGEGQAQNNGGTYTHHYNLTDNLGNVRYTFDIYAGAVRKLQEDNYYPFGLRKVASAGNNRYLYNGKELQDELEQYDYGARFYDPVIARWNVVDPLVEVGQESTSPYIYVLNNPIILTDPDGRLPDPPSRQRLLGATPSKFQTLPSTAEDPDGDQTGIIRQSREDQRLYSPIKAAVIDFTHALLDGLGWGTIDNAAFSDHKLSAGEKVNLGFAMLTALDPPVGGRGGKPHMEGPSPEVAVHGNSKASTKTQHLYEMKNNGSGEVLEYGISGQKLNKNGTSPRVAQKLRTKYKNDPNVSGTVIKKDIFDRGIGLKEEQGAVNLFAETNGGRGPVNQVRPKPKKD